MAYPNPHPASSSFWPGLNLRCLARPLAGEMAAYLQENAIPADALVPVPLHPKRLRERGYNQSALLAAELGRMVGLEVDGASLKRAVHTEPQARTESATLRRRNMAGAFDCQAKSVSGKRVLLVDDVATSGATINGCAIALKKAGAASVWGLTLAREV